MIVVMQDGCELLFVDQPGERLDLWITRRFPGLTRTTVQKWIEAGLVLVNGESVKKRYQPESGDEIQVQFAPPPELSLEPEPMDLDILFEDEDLIVLNKPAGLVVHPGAGNTSGTLVNGLLAHCRSLPSGGVRPGLVHRLDKATSGILVVAKTSEAHVALVQQFAAREVEKIYYAVCHGRPTTSGCSEPLGRDPHHRQKMAVRPDGKNAETSWRLLGEALGLALLEVAPHTGRTHQIRVHLKWVGCPILGDVTYTHPSLATTAQSLPRHWLHAARLTFTHPRTKQRMSLTAPVPQELHHMLPPAFTPFLSSL